MLVYDFNVEYRNRKNTFFNRLSLPSTIRIVATVGKRKRSANNYQILWQFE
jgi:hypothetical protein